MGIGYVALGGFGAKCRTGWSGVDGVDTPWTVMTTRAPAMLKTGWQSILKNNYHLK